MVVVLSQYSHISFILEVASDETVEDVRKYYRLKNHWKSIDRKV